MNKNMVEELKKVCGDIIDDVEAIIAYRKKATEPREVLTVIESKEEIDSITLSPLSFNNPAKLLCQELNKRNGKIAVVAKGCDSRAIRQLVIEEKIDRERVYIIGISCPGVVDYRKFVKKVKFKLSEIESVELLDGKVVITAGSEKQEIPFDEVIFENCLYCSQPTPIEYDVLLGEPLEGRSDFSDIEEIEKLPLEDRWKFWSEEFKKCIRCHACRSVCPLCYCTECLVDPTNLAVSPMTPAEEKASYPRMLGKTISVEDNLFYHLVRVLHHAGRCAECGECERACPMGLPLRKLERKLQKVVVEVFGYKPGEEIPFLSKLDILPEGR